jgi:hypothetical protein
MNETNVQHVSRNSPVELSWVVSVDMYSALVAVAVIALWKSGQTYHKEKLLWFYGFGLWLLWFWTAEKPASIDHGYTLSTVAIEMAMAFTEDPRARYTLR